MVISLLKLRHGYVVAQVETYVCAYTYVYAYVETRLWLSWAETLVCRSIGTLISLVLRLRHVDVYTFGTLFFT